MGSKQLQEFLAMTMIGDGVLAALYPRHHTLVWDVGPRFVRQFVRTMARHPLWIQAFGAAEIGAGLWLAYRQYPQPPLAPDLRRAWARSKKQLIE